VREFDAYRTHLRRLWGGLGDWGREDRNRDLPRIS
jgi:hypothetical protein